MKQIDKLIINSPYEEPKYYWHYDREHRSFERREGRRPAGYVVATPDSRGFDDPGFFVPIELVNKIRPRVKSWREKGYPGVSDITRRLLHHWQDPEEPVSSQSFLMSALSPSNHNHLTIGAAPQYPLEAHQAQKYL